MLRLRVFSTSRSENAGKGLAKALPFRVLRGKLLAACRRESVEARLAVVGGNAPLGGDPAFLQEALEGGIERAVFDLEGFAGGLLDESGDSMSVHGRPAQGAENDEVEGALHDFQAGGPAGFAGHG